jgi:hypothetical protein
MPQNARPKVFLSATTRDLGSYRLKARGVFELLGIEPVEQAGFANRDATLTQKLRDLIDGCDAVVHVVGKTFGIELAPPQSE